MSGLDDKILNNSYDSTDYAESVTAKYNSIAINPLVSDRYEETTTENIDELLMRRRINSQMAELYEASPYFEKYGRDYKKIDRGDISDIYYTFKEELSKLDDHYNIVQIVCAIAEFFEFNYKVLYNDIITLDDKARILETLEESYGLEQQYAKSKKLF